ncbi:MAG: class I SAM-dependent methyltransferase [Candidatus Shapirobacteria bacterium]|nr:class I SAM-dependent methyltransferase [Candidatus Shapirobacteria bacterium]
MDIESYSHLAIQFYRYDLPPLLVKYFPKKIKTILDCGCGDGSTLSALLNYADRQTKIYAIDLSHRRINLVKKNFDRRIIASVDNAETLFTISDKKIDLFISEQVLEHVNDRKMVTAITRVTKRNSIIYLSTVVKSKHAWYFYKNKQNIWVLDPTHLREYPNKSSVLKLFNQTDFQFISEHYQHFHFPLLDMLFKIFKFSNRHIFSNHRLNYLRCFSLPIPGYYKYEIVLKRK